MSSAILYVAIVAIWAGVLIPRWLRRDTSERASDDASTAEDTPAVAEEPVPAPRPRDQDQARARGQDPGRDRDPGREQDVPLARVPKGRPGAAEGRPGAAGVPAEDGPGEDFLRSTRDQEHARVLSARRRLLMLLLVLTAGSWALAGTRLAAWWVMAPPSVMLLGYLALLREAAQADAERRQLIRSRAAEVAAEIAAEPLTPAAPPAPDAEIIDISASAAKGGEEFYDQYADAKLRAVGDLAHSAVG